MHFNTRKCKVLHLGGSHPEHMYEMKNSRGDRLTLEKTILETNLRVNVDNKP